MRNIRFLVGVVVLILLTLFICSCSPKSTNDSGNVEVSTISGTAAAGAPIIGYVYAKGANGNIAIVEIGADGSYSIDVSTLTAPYILYAEGVVNGENVKVYSAVITAGSINITPLTNLVLSSAIAGSTEQSFDGWNSLSITSEDLAVAEAKVQAQLQPLLDAIGISADVDLLSTTFVADHTGLDLLLDSLTIVYDAENSTFSVTNNLTGSTYLDNITTGSDDAEAQFPASDVTNSMSALQDFVDINFVWQILVRLYANSKPTAGELNTSWAPYVADDYLGWGNNKAEELDAWVNGNKGPCVGFSIVGTIKRVMTPGELVGALHTYTKGYLLSMYYTDGCNPGSINWMMVHDGSKWLWFGDRIWLGSYGPKDLATMSVDELGDARFFTGLGINVNDSESNYAYSKGVRSAIVTGPGLPAGGVILENTYPEEEFDIHSPASTCGDNSDEWCLTDEEVATIPNNAEYITYLFAESAATLAGDADPIHTFTPLQTYHSILENKPYFNAELNGSLFPALVSPLHGTLSDLNIPGVVDVTWTLPANTSVNVVELQWHDGTSYNELESILPNCSYATSTTIDSTGFNPPTLWASIQMRATDSIGRSYNANWHYGN